jgi:hypothetical protein
MTEEPAPSKEVTKGVNVSDVGTTVAALNIWLDQAKKLFAGPIDIAFMTLGTVLIAFAVWGRLDDPKTWAAPEFLGLLSLAGVMYLVASVERIITSRAHQADAILKLIRIELDNTVRIVPPSVPALTDHRRSRWIIWPRGSRPVR